MNEPDFKEENFYTRASGKGPDVPQWVQTSFERSLESHAEGVRRQLYEQSGTEERTEPSVAPPDETRTNRESDTRRTHMRSRSLFYHLIDESEHYHWEFGNPVPALLGPIMPFLRMYIAYPSVHGPPLDVAQMRTRRVCMATELKLEAGPSSLGEDLRPDRPIEFDDPPQEYPH